LKKKKILIYGTNFFPEKVGIGKYTSDMSFWLQRNGFEVKVITANKYFPDWKLKTNKYSFELIKGVKVIRCPIWVPTNPRGLNRIIHFFSFIISSLPPLLINLFWTPNLVILIAPSIFFAPSTFLFNYLSNNRTKTWIHIQDYEIEAAFNLGLIKTKILRKLFFYLEYKILNKFNLISTISKDMIANAVSKGINQKKLFLFPNWIDFDFNQSKQNLNLISKKLDYFQNIFRGKIILMYSGSMNKKQDFELLIKVIEYFKNHQNILWVISGEGPSKKIFSNKVKLYNNVKIFNLQPTYFLHEWLKLADIHLLPQKKGISDILFPSKFIGILASGRAVVGCANRDSQLGQLLSEVGFCVDNNNYKEFIMSIKNLIENKKLREELGRNGYLISNKMFNKKIVLRNFVNQIHNLIS